MKVTVQLYMEVVCPHWLWFLFFHSLPNMLQSNFCLHHFTQTMLVKSVSHSSAWRGLPELWEQSVSVTILRHCGPLFGSPDIENQADVHKNGSRMQGVCEEHQQNLLDLFWVGFFRPKGTEFHC